MIHSNLIDPTTIEMDIMSSKWSKNRGNRGLSDVQAMASLSSSQSNNLFIITPCAVSITWVLPHCMKFEPLTFLHASKSPLPYAGLMLLSSIRTTFILSIPSTIIFPYQCPKSALQLTQSFYNLIERRRISINKTDLHLLIVVPQSLFNAFRRKK